MTNALLDSNGRITSGMLIFKSTNVVKIGKQIVEKQRPVIPLRKDAKKNAKNTGMIVW